MRKSGEKASRLHIAETVLPLIPNRIFPVDVVQTGLSREIGEGGNFVLSIPILTENEPLVKLLNFNSGS